MRLHDLKPAPGSKKEPKRLGQGHGSGTGTYAGRGLKGQKARSGGGVRRGFEGGQLPLIQRMPSKRGFTNIFKIHYQLVKLGQLDRFEADAEITPEILESAGLIDNKNKPIKILSDGTLSKAITVIADKFSSSAVEKLQAAGGKSLGRDLEPVLSKKETIPEEESVVTPSVVTQIEEPKRRRSRRAQVESPAEAETEGQSDA